MDKKPGSTKKRIENANLPRIQQKWTQNCQNGAKNDPKWTLIGPKIDKKTEQEQERPKTSLKRAKIKLEKIPKQTPKRAHNTALFYPNRF